VGAVIFMDKKTLAKEAFLAFREGDYDKALETYRQIVENDPTDVTVMILAGDICALQNKIADALRYYKTVVQLLFQQSESKNKIELVKNKMIRLDPDSTDDIEPPPSDAEIAKRNTPDVVQAVDQLKGEIASDPKNFENYQKLGDVLAKSGRKAEAAEQYLVIGNALYNNRMYKKAGAVFQRIVKLDPTCLLARIALGEVYAKDGSDSDAKKEFLYVAEGLIRQGNLERGQQFAQKAIQMKSIEAHYYLGVVFCQTEQLEDARTEFETLLKFKVNHIGGLIQLASIRAAANQTDEAYQLYERVMKKDSKNADVFERMARLGLEQNDVSRAVEHFTKAMEAFAATEEWERAAINAYEAVKLDPSNQELYLKMADASYNANLEEQAAEACASLADLLEGDGKDKEAAEMRVKVAELTGQAPPAPKTKPQPKPDPKPESAPPAQTSKSTASETTGVEDPQVMLNIADTYVQQGSLDEAIEIYQKILKSDPNNEKVKSALTRVYAMFAGINPETAVARKATPVKPATPKPADEKEEQRVQREARERALREAQVRAQRSSVPEPKNPTKGSAKEDEMLQSIGNTRGDEIAGDNQDEFMTVTVAEIYTKQGLLNEALKIYQKILEIEPGNMEAQVKKQELEKKMVEQEKLNQKSQKAASEAKTEPAKESKPTAKEESKVEASKPTPAAKPEEPKKETKADEPKTDAAKKDKNDDDHKEPPPPKSRRGRVSYV
jgi:tetratricopeptide (TPR) repeat protein